MSELLPVGSTNNGSLSLCRPTTVDDSHSAGVPSCRTGRLMTTEQQPVTEGADWAPAATSFQVPGLVSPPGARGGSGWVPSWGKRRAFTTGGTHTRRYFPTFFWRRAESTSAAAVSLRGKAMAMDTARRQHVYSDLGCAENRSGSTHATRPGFGKKNLTGDRYLDLTPRGAGDVTRCPRMAR